MKRHAHMFYAVLCLIYVPTSLLCSTSTESHAVQDRRTYAEERIDLPYEVNIYSRNTDYVQALVDARRASTKIYNVTIKVSFLDSQLRDVGIDEIRFEELLPGFVHQKVVKKKYAAAKFTRADLMRYKVVNNPYLQSDNSLDEYPRDIVTEAAERELDERLRKQRETPQALEGPGRIRSSETLCEAEVSVDHNKLLASADVIVIGTAPETVASPSSQTNAVVTSLAFKVAEVLKGQNIPSVLEIEGALSDNDHYNSSDAPGEQPDHKGPCYVKQYKKGGNFLFILRNVNGKLTPYWTPGAQTNEQIRSEQDAWLEWVKNRLRSG